MVPDNNVYFGRKKMQKIKPLDGKVYLKNMTTGEYIEWNSVTEITCEDFEGEFEQQEYYQEILNKFYEAADEIEVKGNNILDTIKKMLEEQETVAVSLKDAIKDNLEDDKTPNPIYIPKHIQHRKRGRK